MKLIKRIQEDINGLYLEVPQIVLDALNLKANEKIVMSIKGKKLIVRKQHLQDLLDTVSTDYALKDDLSEEEINWLISHD
jgi:antitoxin component of MazEF toxin-antitoxin module